MDVCLWYLYFFRVLASSIRVWNRHWVWAYPWGNFIGSNLSLHQEYIRQSWPLPWILVLALLALEPQCFHMISLSIHHQAITIAMIHPIPPPPSKPCYCYGIAYFTWLVCMLRVDVESGLMPCFTRVMLMLRWFNLGNYKMSNPVTTTWVAW